MYQNQSKQIMKVSLPHYGTNKCKKNSTIPNNKLDIKSAKIKKEHAC